jgi:hypothetical protein
MTSLDDLLDGGAREHVPSRGRRHLWWAVKAVLASAALAAALVVVLIVLGYRMSYPAAAAGVLAALTLHRVIVGLGVLRYYRHFDNLEREPGQGNRDGLAPAVNQWHAKLRWDRAGLWRSTRTLQPSLAELVDERLRQRHGYTRADDPARARTLLGEKLWSYLADPAARTPPPRDLAAMLTTVEEL